MKGNLKNKLFFFLGILTIIFSVSSVSSCQDVAKQKKLIYQERRRRMEFEERVLNLSNRNADLEREVNQLRERLDKQKAACRVTQQALEQEILRLKGESEKVY